MNLYHGTTKNNWNSDNPDKVIESGNLYVVKCYNEAKIYSEETGESEWDEEIHIEGGNSPLPIIVQFDMDQLNLLRLKGLVSFEPDWGWIQALEADTKQTYDNLTWEDSFNAVGSFCVNGFNETHKKLGTVLGSEENIKHEKKMKPKK